MRDIEFRGKDIDSGEWIYGDLLQYRVLPVIFDSFREQHECYGQTIGQYTGLNDKNGQKIYEHDIVKDSHDELAKIVYVNRCAYFGFEYGNKTEVWHFGIVEGKHLEVVGNVFNNPELLAVY